MLKKFFLKGCFFIVIQKSIRIGVIGHTSVFKKKKKKIIKKKIKKKKKKKKKV